MSGPDICIRCGVRPAAFNLDWLHCEPCYNVVCDEVEQARAGLYDAPPDPIGRLMIDEGLSFVEAVERLAAERGLQ